MNDNPNHDTPDEGPRSIVEEPGEPAATDATTTRDTRLQRIWEGVIASFIAASLWTVVIWAARSWITPFRLAVGIAIIGILVPLIVTFIWRPRWIDGRPGVVLVSASLASFVLGAVIVSYGIVTPRSFSDLLRGDGQQGEWTYSKFVVGVGDLNGNKIRDVLAVSEDGHAILIDVENDGTVADWTKRTDEWKFDLLAGVGDVDGDDLPEILATRGEDGYLLQFTSEGERVGQQLMPCCDWEYEALAGVGSVNGDESAEVVAINTDDTDADELLYLNNAGFIERGDSQPLPEGDYMPITGIGDIDADGVPEALGILGNQGHLLRFHAGGYSVGEVSGLEDYDFLTGLEVFGGKGPSDVLAVSTEEACILRFQPDGTYSTTRCHR